MHFIRISGGITGNVHMSGVRDCYMSLLNMLMTEYRTSMPMINTAIVTDNQGHYKLFDFHSRDRRNNVAISGKSVVLDFSGVEEKVQYVRSFYAATSVVPFEIVGVEVTDAYLQDNEGCVDKISPCVSLNAKEHAYNSGDVEWECCFRLANE